MMSVKIIYTNGKTETFPCETYAKHVKRIAKELKNKKGLTYIRFLEGNLAKAYIGDELVIDREQVLEATE